MSTVALDVPDDTLLALKLEPRAAAAELRLVAAMKLYEMGRLASGCALGAASPTGDRTVDARR